MREQFELKEDGKRWEFYPFLHSKTDVILWRSRIMSTQIVNINYVFILFCRYHSGGGDNYP